MSNDETGAMLDCICEDLEQVRASRPLVHSITNYVVMNFTANVLLALGASPVMAHAPEEMEEMVGLAGALVINIGTLSTPWIESMIKAAEAARRLSVPIVFDPVGAGATSFRTDTAGALITMAEPSIIRANASEIMAVAGQSVQVKGVDSSHDTSEATRAALALARSTGAVVAVTGAEDFVTDGVRSVRILNGHPLMSRVTGTGCAATALMGAFRAIEPNALTAAVAALVAFGVVGECAAESNPGPGTYQSLLLDWMDAVGPDSLRERARFEII